MLFRSSTSVMIQLGKVKGNKMVEMKLSNNKLVQRGVEMLMSILETNEKTAKMLLSKHGNVRKAILTEIKKEKTKKAKSE